MAVKRTDYGDGATGPWHGRVEFGPGGGFAFRPGEIVVRAELAEIVVRILTEKLGKDIGPIESVGREAFVRIGGLPDPLAALEELAQRGIVGQVNHVLFATTCCPPHPADPSAAPFYANPFYANPFYANPFYANAVDANGVDANPFYANPFYANPFYANPFYANSGSGCCGCGCGQGAGANPFYANPFYANPFYANADPNPALNPSANSTGRRSSSARPAAKPDSQPCDVDGDTSGVRIAILDTGFAADAFAPAALEVGVGSDRDDLPDEDGDLFLDPAAGHGTFIAGVIEQLTPGCSLEVIAVLSTYGDGDEVVIANELHSLAARPQPERPHIVNLSFGGYSPVFMAVLADAVSALVAAGVVVVASAGNDGTCMPIFPAALPDVVGVAALHGDGRPAEFTNYGPWVRACTVGVDVVSTFFDHFDGNEGKDANGDEIDEFSGWAVWSGTSFAAPRVVAALAQLCASGVGPADAVAKLVDDPSLDRKPMLGTVVLVDEPS